MFWKPNKSLKDKKYFFSASKQRNKVYSMYLQCKPQWDTYSFPVKMEKIVEKNIYRKKKTTKKYRSCFWKIRCLRKVDNCVLGLSQKPIKVRCISLTLKTSNLAVKKVNRKPKRKVPMMFFKVQIQHDRCSRCYFNLNWKNQSK